MGIDEKTLVLCVCLVSSVIQGCSSGSNNNDSTTPAVPDAFVTVQARYDPTPMLTPQPIDISPIVTDSDRRDLWLTGVSSSVDSDIIGIAHRVRTSTPGIEFDEYLVYDTLQVMFSSLLQIDPLFSPSISSDLFTAAWIEQCLGYVQTLGGDVDPILINSLAPEGSCLRPARVSAGGELALFNNARGRLDAESRLQFDGFDSDKYGPLAYRVAGNYAISLAGQDLKLEGMELGENIPLYLHTSVSDNGRIVALRTGFVPEGYSSLGEIEFRAGILIVNTDTRSISLIDPHQERRIFCRVCYFNPATDTLISGDGRFVFFLRPDDEDLLDTSSTSYLYRHDIERGETIRLPIDDKIDKDSLTVDRAGNHIAYVSEGRLLVLRLNTGARIELHSAILGCFSPECSECEFENYRLVRNNPFAFSGDGSKLLIQVVPERPGIDSPQNTEEVLVLNISTQLISRLAPDISVDRVEIDNAGKLVVFQTDSASLIPNDDDSDTDFFVVRY